MAIKGPKIAKRKECRNVGMQECRNAGMQVLFRRGFLLHDSPGNSSGMTFSE
jgi:hypothetical protein